MRKWLKIVLVAVVAGFLVPAAQAGGEELSPGALMNKAMRAMQSGDTDQAIHFLNLYLDSVRDSKIPRVVLLAQKMRMRLVRLLLSKNRYDEAVAVLQEYVKQPTGKKRTAYKMLTSCAYKAGDFQSCVDAATNALHYNENALVAEVVKKGKGDTFVKKKDDDPPYTPEEITQINFMLADSLMHLGKYREAIKPFTYVIEHTDDDAQKGYAIMQIIDALMNLEDYARIKVWIPQLYRTPARYDIRVNLALLNVANKLYEIGDYDSALPLYRMILPREELIAYQKERLRQMRVDYGLPPEEGMEMTEEEKELFGMDTNTTAQTEQPLPPEIQRLEGLIKQVEGLAPYEDIVTNKMAELYHTVDRYWESVEFYHQVFLSDPQSDIGKHAFSEMISVLLTNLDERAEAERYAFDFMSKYTNGLAPRDIAYKFVLYYHSKGDMKGIKNLEPYIKRFDPADDKDETIRKYDTELFFMQAVADLQLFNYKKAEKEFKYVLDRFPGSHQEDNAFYWYALSKMFQQRYQDAFDTLQEYIRKFRDKKGRWLAEAYYQGGVCLFGLEKYDMALRRFSLVIKQFPDSSVYPNACNMRGDIYGSRGELEKAEQDYKNAMAAARKLGKVKPATYAVFQLTDIYEALERYDKIAELVQSYLDYWGGKADVAKALFWIGRSKIQQEKVDEAVNLYIDAIVKYGGDVKQNGVDMIIDELVKIAVIWLDEKGQAELVDKLKAAIGKTDNMTVKLRLRVAIAKLTHTEEELGKQLIKELPSLEDAPPPVLSLICEVSLEEKDYSRAKELLDIFKKKFEDSPDMKAAYKLYAYSLYEQKKYDEALKVAKEAQGDFGTDPEMAWAQLMRAEIYYKQGRLDEARKTAMDTLSVSGWRGEPYAHASYLLGLIEEKAGHWRQAFAFYQRTYALYKAYGDGKWAAKAYLGSIRCLKKLGMEEAIRRTYEAMLYDPYVNTLPEADVARKALGPEVVARIEADLKAGRQTNIAVNVEVKKVGMWDVNENQTSTNDSEAVEASEEIDPAVETTNTDSAEEQPVEQSTDSSVTDNKKDGDDQGDVAEESGNSEEEAK